MYTIINNKIKYKKTDNTIDNLIGFNVGIKNKVYSINKQEVINLVIYNKTLAHPLVKEQVEKRYNKLMKLLTKLLVSDDEEGEGLVEALNQIEKFRQIIKNKYRLYLNKKELENMSKKLSLIQKEAKNRMLEIEINLKKSQKKSSCK